MNLLNGLFNVFKKSDDLYLVKLSNSAHPIFKAHFPNNPILPGFIQIDLICNILKHTIVKLIKVKFFSTINPEDEIYCYIKYLSDNRYKVVIKRENLKLSEIIYETR